MEPGFKMPSLEVFGAWAVSIFFCIMAIRYLIKVIEARDATIAKMIDAAREAGEVRARELRESAAVLHASAEAQRDLTSAIREMLAAMEDRSARAASLRAERNAAKRRDHQE